MNSETIAYFQEQSCKSTTTARELQFLSKAIWALQKRHPTLVINEKTFWHYYHYCPSCGIQLKIEGEHYCSRCGQCLDWSNYQEGLKRGKRTNR